MNLSKLENLEAIALIAIIMINNIILNFPKNIILSSGSSAWLNTIYISIIAIIFAYVIAKLFKNFSTSDILDVSNYLGGKFLKVLIGIIYIIFFLIFAILLIRNFSESLKIIYFNNSPITFLILFFVFTLCFANRYGIKVIAKVNLILAPIIFISILLILFSSSTSFEFQRLLPILGYGSKQTFFYGLTNIFAFTGLAYLFFLPPLLKNTKSFKRISIISIIISAIFLFLSVTCLLLVFSFITSSNESISIYLLTRMVKHGEFIQKANAIFVLIWILAVLSYCSIIMFFILHITKKLTNIEDTNSINYCYGSIILGGSLLIANVAQYINFTESILKYSFIIFIFFINIPILILANIKHSLSKR
jgi:spore germination protein KB